MNPGGSEADARIVIDDMLRQAGWNPVDKSMVGTEVPSSESPEIAGYVHRSVAKPFETHAPVYNLVAAAGEFGPDMTVGAATEEVGWKTVPGHVRLARDHFVARVEGHSMEPTIPDRSYCLFRADRGGSREGKLVLVWHRGCSDPGLGGEFSVKKYTSTKAVVSGDGAWEHREIRLKPLNPDLEAGNGASLFPHQAERFRWSKWRFKSGDALRNFVRDEVFPYMASLVKDEPYVSDYFRDAVLEIVDPNVLKQVLDELDSIDFRKLGPDIKGDIFEYLLTHLGQSALNGQFRTPRQIRAFMVQMVDPDLGDTVYDPACGTAGFLIDVVDHILARYSEDPQETPIYGEDWLEKREQTLEEAKEEIPNLQTYRKGTGEKIPDWRRLEASIYGTDVSRQMMRIASMNLVLHGIRRANLKRANVLSEMGGLTEDDLNRRYSVILSNPPFAGQIPAESIRQDLPSKSKKSELLFLALMLRSLAPGGRCAVVVPEGALFGSTKAHKELREKLLREYEVQGVVSLPAGVFKPYAGVKTSVLVFRRPATEPEEGKPATRQVWFYEVHNDGYDPDKIQGGGRPETPDENDVPGLLTAWADYKATRFQEPPGTNVDALLDAGSEEPRCWWTVFKTIADNDFNLAASRYRPRVTEPVPYEDPAELIREILAIEKEITASLKKLLGEVEHEARHGRNDRRQGPGHRG